MSVCGVAKAVDRGARWGFTLVEILLAVAILVIGLLGILALFPVAIYSSKKSIEETTASLLAQSVEQSIREGLQHRKGQSKDGRWTFFVFQGDGVEDRIPPRIQNASPSDDYYILLPEILTDDVKTAVDRTRAYEQGKIFVYPETDGKQWEQTFVDGAQISVQDNTSKAPPNGGGSPEKADDDGDDIPDPNQLLFLKTYQYGSTLVPEDSTILEHGANVPIEERDAIETAQNYSYAFSIRRAFNDASLGRHFPISLPVAPDKVDLDRQIIPANELFEVTIWVFRSFRPPVLGEGGEVQSSTPPVYSSVFLVHK